MNRVQTTYLIGQLSIPAMPPAYRATANALSWVTLDFEIPQTPSQKQAKAKAKSENDVDDGSEDPNDPNSRVSKYSLKVGSR